MTFLQPAPGCWWLERGLQLPQKALLLPSRVWALSSLPARIRMGSAKCHQCRWRRGPRSSRGGVGEGRGSSGGGLDTSLPSAPIARRMAGSPGRAAAKSHQVHRERRSRPHDPHVGNSQLHAVTQSVELRLRRHLCARCYPDLQQP